MRRALLLALVVLHAGDVISFQHPATLLRGCKGAHRARSALPGRTRMGLSEQESEQVGRRSVLSLLSTLGAAQLFSSFSKDAVAAEAADGNDGVCQSMLGCNQPKNLPPPKKVYRDIFEEERELARQREAEAEAARAEQRKKQMLALKNQTEVLISGRKTLEKDMQEVVKQLDGQADDFSAWDDVRRMARLYDTALRKDGMNLLIDKLRNSKLQIVK